jgi:YidC/Oxa1 family membrane protein insertase
MDRKAVIVLALSFILLMLWYPLINQLFPPIDVPQPPAEEQSDALPPSSPPEMRATAPLPEVSPAEEFRPDAPERLLVVENSVARYTFTSHGGGIKLVELKDFPAEVTCGKEAAEGRRASLNTGAPRPAMSLHGGQALQGDGIYELQRTDRGVRAQKQLPNGLLLIKDFQIGTDYMLSADVRLENTSLSPISLPPQEWVLGTSTPISTHEETFYLGLQWYNGNKAQRIAESWFANRTLGCLPGTPRPQYFAGQSNVVWGAVHNQFFAIAAVPDQPAPAVVGRRVDLPRPTEAQLQSDSRVFANPFGYQTAFVYPEMILAPGQQVQRRFEVFAGPKEYNTLARLGHNLDLVMDFGGFFGFFSKALLLGMNGFHAMGLTYGLAIIAVTVVIKLLFWPLTNASTKSMKRMAALQPEMKALQEKYKEDPKKMQMKLMEFMREKKVSPLGGCLPLLLQIPVFFGFYKMLQAAIELRGAQFLWACDLSQPDTVAVIGGFPINILPLLMGATMLWQSHMTPVSPGMDPTQQKIMRYMPLIFVVFLYRFSAGLTLYWTVQNLLTILQMKLTKTTEPAKPATPGGAAAPGPKPAGPKKRK